MCQWSQNLLILTYLKSDITHSQRKMQNVLIQFFFDIFKVFRVSYLCKLKRGSLYYLTMGFQAMSLQATRTIH